MAMFHLGTRTFPSKAAARREVQRILHGTPLRTFLAGDEFELVRDLLELHPKADGKIGVGVRAISVEPTLYGHYGFFAHRLDDTSVDFSYQECFRPSTPWDNVRSALRWEVEDQVREVRQARFQDSPQCDYCGFEVTAEQPAHVDHGAPTFRELVATFVNAYSRSRDGLPEVVDHGMAELRLANRELAAIWQRYHQTKAVLQVLHVDCHRELPV